MASMRRDRNAGTTDTRQLVYVSLVAATAMIVVAISMRLVSRAAPALDVNQKQTLQSSVATAEKKETDRGGSPGGIVFSVPVMEPPRAFTNQQPWKGRYPPDALVQAEELAKPEIAKRLILLDACPRSQYENSHIPGALWIDYLAWKHASCDSREQPAWEKRIGALGIDVDTPVAIYDAGSGRESEDIRSILLYWGIKDVRLLDGGWPSWLLQGGRHESVVPHVTARPITLRPNPPPGGNP